MTCNSCNKEMTLERGVLGRADSWWCPRCGSTKTMYSADKQKPAEEKPEKASDS